MIKVGKKITIGSLNLLILIHCLSNLCRRNVLIKIHILEMAKEIKLEIIFLYSLNYFLNLIL